jgi:beta-phosphoglucomutase
MTGIKACIFDLDGVLVDTARYHYLAWKRLALDEFGFLLSVEDNERLKGVSRMQSLDIILSLAGRTLSDLDKERVATKKNGWFTEAIHKMDPNEIFPGVKSLLQRLRGDKMKIALASSSKNAKTIINILGIENSFDVVVDGNMIVNTKPDPEIFLMAARKLNVSPEACLVFEDAEAGVEAAQRAGMKCIGIGSPDQLSKANLVIDAVSQFDFTQLKSIGN